MSKIFLRRLQNMHRNIDRRIAKEQRLANCDPHKLGELKKLRLLIKDKIARVDAMVSRNKSMFS